jgi:hypothetical protein
MSLYQILYGKNRAAAELLGRLGFTENDIPRFRDCYVEDGMIVVLTRTGGGNREEYEVENKTMCDHPYYIKDQDAKFDETYAEFFYRIPRPRDQEQQAAAGGEGGAAAAVESHDLVDALGCLPEGF